MNEKILNKNKNGMAVLLLVILGYVAGIAGVVFMAAFGYFLGWLFVPVMAILIAWLALGWILLCGLKVLKPQEALVLTHRRTQIHFIIRITAASKNMFFITRVLFRPFF